MTDAIIEAIGRCNPDEALQPDSPLYYDFERVRNMDLHRRITRLLAGAETERRYSHIAFSGHRGCGKSTELLRVAAQAEREGYLTLYTNVNEQADQNELSFGDLFLLMLRLLEARFRQPPLRPLPEKTVRVVEQWFHDVTRIQAQELERALAYSGEAGLGVDTPLGKLLFGLNVLRKSTGTEREEIRESVEKYPAQLRENLNLLLDDARKIARDAYPRGLLFVLDALDRYTPDMVSQAVVKNAELFKGVNAHLIFVLPISLAYDPLGETVEDRFTPVTMPMITVFQRDERRAPADFAIAELTAAIFKRVDLSLFADPGLARELARLSGGCPRDLMRLLQETLLVAERQIDERAVKRAASLVRAEMTRKLTRDQYRQLAQVMLDGQVNPDAAGRELLYRRFALEYNGDRWAGVHPLLWDAPEFKAALEAEKQARGGAVQSV
jgi:hypothetical protein